MQASRRRFLKSMGLGAAAARVAGYALRTPFPASASITKPTRCHLANFSVILSLLFVRSPVPMEGLTRLPTVICLAPAPALGAFEQVLTAAVIAALPWSTPTPAPKQGPTPLQPTSTPQRLTAAAIGAMKSVSSVLVSAFLEAKLTTVSSQTQVSSAGKTEPFMKQLRQVVFVAVPTCVRANPRNSSL